MPSFVPLVALLPAGAPAYYLGMQRDDRRLLIILLIFIALLAVWAWPDDLSVSTVFSGDPMMPLTHSPK